MSFDDARSNLRPLLDGLEVDVANLFSTLETAVGSSRNPRADSIALLHDVWNCRYRLLGVGLSSLSTPGAKNAGIVRALRGLCLFNDDKQLNEVAKIKSNIDFLKACARRLHIDYFVTGEIFWDTESRNIKTVVRLYDAIYSGSRANSSIKLKGATALDSIGLMVSIEDSDFYCTKQRELSTSVPRLISLEVAIPEAIKNSSCEAWVLNNSSRIAHQEFCDLR